MATQQSGNNLLIKVASTYNGTTYTTIAGLTNTTMTFNRADVDTTTKDAASYVQNLPAGGAKSFTISGEGIFDNSTTQQLLMDVMTASTHWNFQIVDEVDSTWTFAGSISSYERTGAVNGVDTFRITINSSGVVTFVQGS